MCRVVTIAPRMAIPICRVLVPECSGQANFSSIQPYYCTIQGSAIANCNGNLQCGCRLTGEGLAFGPFQMFFLLI